MLSDYKLFKTRNMANGLKIEGTFHERLDDVTFSSGNKKAEFVLEMVTSGKNGKDFREFPKFEVVEKFMSMLDNVDVGDKVAVEFSVGGRAWQPEGSDIKKYFTTLKAWDVTVIQKADGQMMATDINKKINLNGPDPVDEMFADTDDADLPF